MPDFVRVKNIETRKFDFHNNNVKKIIPAGKEMVMPWGLAATLFGDPYLADAPKKPDRTDALARARGNFNFELGMETLETFDDRRHHVEVYDMESGQRIFMLIDDPEGEHTVEYINPEDDSGDQMMVLQRQVEQLTAQLGILIEQRTNEPMTPMPTGQSVTVSEDGPMQTGAKQAVFIDGDPMAQRPEDATSVPLWDFAQMSTMSPDDLPPSAATGEAPIIVGEPVVVPLPFPDEPIYADAHDDAPQDAGVGSADATAPTAPAKLAPRKR